MVPKQTEEENEEIREQATDYYWDDTVEEDQLLNDIWNYAETEVGPEQENTPVRQNKH